MKIFSLFQPNLSFIRNNHRLIFNLKHNRAFSSSFELQSTESSSNVVDLLTLELPTNENSPTLLKMRHTTAHVMAMAVQKVFPSVKVTIGPWIDNGYAIVIFL